MFSKEWNLVALCLAATISLTACPRNKKSSTPESTSAYAGLWVNERSVQLLEINRVNPDPALCADIFNEPEAYGLSISQNGRSVTLDAWKIHPRGEVYRYSVTENSQAQGYSNSKFHVGHVSGDFYSRNTQSGTTSSYTVYQYQTGSPFFSKTGILAIESDRLSAASSDNFNSSALYFRVNDQQLLHISTVQVNCSRILKAQASCQGAKRCGPRQAVIVERHAQRPEVLPARPLPPRTRIEQESEEMGPAVPGYSLDEGYDQGSDLNAK